MFAFVFVSVFHYLAKRLAGRNVSEMTYFVSGGTWNLNSVSHFCCVWCRCLTMRQLCDWWPVLILHATFSVTPAAPRSATDVVSGPRLQTTRLVTTVSLQWLAWCQQCHLLT